MITTVLSFILAIIAILGYGTGIVILIAAWINFVGVVVLLPRDKTVWATVGHLLKIAAFSGALGFIAMNAHLSLNGNLHRFYG